MTVSLKSLKEEMWKTSYTVNAKQFGLKPEWLGKTFEHDGKTYTVAGLNFSSAKYPVVTKEGVRFNADFFKMLMTGDQKAYENVIAKKREQKLEEARKDYLAYATFNGLEKHWLNKSFTDGKHTYVVVGLKCGRRSTRVVTQREDGRVYDWPHNVIIQKMKAKEKAA